MHTQGLSDPPSYREIGKLPVSASFDLSSEGTFSLEPSSINQEGSAQNQTPWECLTIISEEAPSPRDYQAAFLAESFERPKDSFLLQSPTGSGKTFTALYAAAAHLEKCERVVFVVPTIDLAQQTFAESQRVFGGNAAFIRNLAGMSPARRERVYSDPDSLLLIVVAPSAARDLIGVRGKVKEDGENTLDSADPDETPEAPKGTRKQKAIIDISKVGLLILDEGDLMRGDEPLARINRFWKRQKEKPRCIIMSATLTIADNPGEDHNEVIALKKKTGINNWVQLFPDRESSYWVNREKVTLPPLIQEAARDIGSDYWSHLRTVRDLVASIDSQVRIPIDAILQKLFESEGQDRFPFILPTIKIRKQLPDALKALRKENLGWEEGRDLQLAIRTSFEIDALAHAHKMLVTNPRVDFLEYAGRMLYLSRTMGAKPHQAQVFPPGVTPWWWRELSKGTAYELIAGVNALRLNPMTEFLALYGVTATTKAEVAAKFFCSNRALGVAALDLLRRPFEEHPWVNHVQLWLTGQSRRVNPGQAMVCCDTAVSARYLAEYFRIVTQEETLALMGQSHSSPVERRDAFANAKSGKASILCGTSVLGRGVDMDQLKYLLDPTPDPDVRIAKQKFGRVGRQDSGTVVVITTEGSYSQVYDLARRVKAESMGAVFPENKIHRKQADNSRFKQGRLFD